jgi:pimeloyl-ACP methyl ester carboxylesterase
VEKQTELDVGSRERQNDQPDLERWYATRASSHKVEVPGASHSVYVSHPKEVAALIENAAQQVR